MDKKYVYWETIIIKYKKIVLIIIFIILLFVVFMFCHINNENNNMDNVSYVDAGYGEYDIYLHDEFDNEYSEDEYIDLSEGNFKGCLHVGQYSVGHIQNYILIILLDYVQTDFIYQNDDMSSLHFSLSDNEEQTIKFAIDELDADASEISFLVFPEPDLNDFSTIENQMLGQTMLQLRVSSNKVHNKIETYYTANTFDNKCSSDLVFLSKSISKMKLVTKAAPNDTLKLIIGNMDDNESVYAIVPISNWSQYDIEDQKVNYTRVAANSYAYMDINIPEENGPFQIIVFKNPFSEDSQLEYVDTTSRLIVR